MEAPFIARINSPGSLSRLKYSFTASVSYWTRNRPLLIGQIFGRSLEYSFTNLKYEGYSLPLNFSFSALPINLNGFLTFTPLEKSLESDGDFFIIFSKTSANGLESCNLFSI